jgi:hypothetical protein
MLKKKLTLCTIITLLALLMLVPSLYAQEIKVDFDNFKTVSGSWKTVNGGYQNIDISSGNSNAYMELAQEGTELIYEWTITFADTTLGYGPCAGMHFLADDATMNQRGNSYCVFQDKTHIRVYKPVKSNQSSLGKIIDFPAPAMVGDTHTYKVEINTKTGDMKFFRDGKLIGQYKDSAPYTSGKYISLRTGGTVATFKDIKVTVK